MGGDGGQEAEGIYIYLDFWLSNSEACGELTVYHSFPIISASRGPPCNRPSLSDTEIVQ